MTARVRLERLTADERGDFRANHRATVPLLTQRATMLFAAVFGFGSAYHEKLKPSVILV
jgi:hypothetical protein